MIQRADRRKIKAEYEEKRSLLERRLAELVFSPVELKKQKDRKAEQKTKQNRAEEQS